MEEIGCCYCLPCQLIGITKDVSLQKYKAHNWKLNFENTYQYLVVDEGAERFCSRYLHFRPKILNRIEI